MEDETTPNVNPLGRARSQHSGLALPPENPDRDLLFRLSDDERRRALELKAAVEKADDLENLPDLQYVQFVLTFQGGLDLILDRVRGLQAFRCEYKIKDTFEEGMALISDFIKYHPECILSVAYDDNTENYGLIYDRSRTNHHILQSHEQWRIFLGAAYYLFNTLSPDPLSTRHGIFLIAECQGTESKLMKIDTLRQVWYHFLHHLPVKFHSIKAFHSNTVANLSYSMMKPFMRDDVRNRIMLGCQFAVNLSSLYLLPTPEIATQRTLKRIADFMTTRYENQATFSLSS